MPPEIGIGMLPECPCENDSRHHFLRRPSPHSDDLVRLPYGEMGACYCALLSLRGSWQVVLAGSHQHDTEVPRPEDRACSTDEFTVAPTPFSFPVPGHPLSPTCRPRARPASPQPLLDPRGPPWAPACPLQPLAGQRPGHRPWGAASRQGSRVSRAWAVAGTRRGRAQGPVPRAGAARGQRRRHAG